MLEPLTPKLLSPTDASYKTIEELQEVLSNAINNPNSLIRNIALTGPYGAGKSSVLVGLQKHYASEFHFLPLSLATLSLPEHKKTNNSNKDPKSENNNTEIHQTNQINYESELNRRIEFSLLQQIVYKEKQINIPNSRFRRIKHWDEYALCWHSFGFILCIVALWFLFDPKILRIDSIYNVLSLGSLKIFLDFACLFYLFIYFSILIQKVIKLFSNSKLNKLSLKDGSIEFEEEHSIFNKHLDEILYFFQVTNYNVVILEDLDRFNTSKIFLKLRELNMLLNQAKDIDRRIIFLYAVKDDLFKDEDRTKFFDYITTVIPVINSSNAKDKLKAAITHVDPEGAKQIKDGEFADIGFFIQDMRLLTNIANEYKQYLTNLSTIHRTQLNRTKLLAMITYKNYFPDDFAKLPRRDGAVYQAVVLLKPKLQEIASKTTTEELSKIQQKIETLEVYAPTTDRALRRTFLDQSKKLYNLTDNEQFHSFNIEDEWVLLHEIINTPSYFQKLVEIEVVYFKYKTNDYYSIIQEQRASNHFHEIAKEFGCENPSLLGHGYEDLKQKAKELKLQRQNIKRQPLYKLLNQSAPCLDELKKLALPALIQHFIRRGYLDETYHDYISYFYDEMLSEADRNLLLSIKQEEPLDPSYPIDHIENFVEELQPYMFNSNAILNNNLLTYLASHRSKYSELFELFMQRLEANNLNLEFIAQFYETDNQNTFPVIFRHLTDWNKSLLWRSISNCSSKEIKDVLIEAWLVNADQLDNEQIKWLNTNYDFLANCFEVLGLEKCKSLVEQCKFTSLSLLNKTLLQEVIRGEFFELNPENLKVLAQHLHLHGLSLSNFRATKEPTLIKYVEKHIQEVLPLFDSEASKNESPNSLLWLLNHNTISEEVKIKYLTKQKQFIPTIDDVEDAFIEVAFKSFIIAPTWHNIYDYFVRENSKADTLSDYIEKYYLELGQETEEEKINNSHYEDLYQELLQYPLSPACYRVLVNAFEFDTSTSFTAKNLEHDNLAILLEANKLPFSEQIANEIKNDCIYCDYLTQHINYILQAQNNVFFSDSVVLEKLLLSPKLTPGIKEQIISITPDNVLSSNNIANLIFDPLLKLPEINLTTEKLIQLFSVDGEIDKKIKLLSKVINELDKSSLLKIFPKLKYGYETIPLEENTKIPKEYWHSTFSSVLKKHGFISNRRSSNTHIILIKK